MTQETTEMAEGCGFTRTHTGEVQLWLCNKNDLERLVKLVAAKEREELKNTVGLMQIEISELPTVTKVMALIHARSNS